MTEEDRKLIGSFEGKLRHFMFLFDELKQENADLKLLLRQKEEEIKLLEQSRKELEARYTDLKMARTISFRYSEFRFSRVMTFSQSHWST